MIELQCINVNVIVNSFGTKASWQDPVKYNFAHGDKDNVPYPY